MRTAGSVGHKTAAAIKSAALSLFAQHGYGAVSMRMIADAVGVNPGTLYNHFPSKQALLVALMTGHLDALQAAYQEFDHASDPVAALEDFARFHVRYHISRPDDVFIAYMELRALEPEGFAAVEIARGAYEATLRAIIEDGVRTGAFADIDPTVATNAILAMLTGVTTWYRPGGRLSETEIEDSYAAMSLRMMGVLPHIAQEAQMKRPAHV